MAKHATRHMTTRHPASTAHELTIVKKAPEPTTRTRHLIDAIKAPFRAFVGEFEALTMSRRELAPKFVKAFEAFKEDTGLKLISFVRLLDDSVPVERDEYKNHPSYVAATNLNRLANEDATPRKAIPASRRPATPLVALARLVATVLPIVDPDGAIWDAFLKEIHWSEEQGKRLQALSMREKAIPLAPQRVGAMRRRAAVNE